MKHYLILTILALSLLATACSSAGDEPTAAPAAVEAPTVAAVVKAFANGSTMSVSSGSGAVASRGGDETDWFTPHKTTLEIAPEVKEDIIANHISIFPEKVNNLGKEALFDLDNFSYDFLYTSSGETFQVMLLYTCYYNARGDKVMLFWLDENGEFDPANTVEIWSEKSWGTELTSKRGPNYWIPEDNAAVEVALPAGTRFGFVLWNATEQTYHFSMRHLNTEKNPDFDPAKCDVYSMVTYVRDDFQIISMDATFPVSSSYDADVNDLVLLMNPVPPAIPAITPLRLTDFDDVELRIYLDDIDTDLLCEVDDFALSNNLERYPEHYNIGADPNRRIKVEKDDYLEITVSDFANLEYNEELQEWTYETWIWLNAVPSRERYLIGEANAPDWETYSNAAYDIGVSVFEGIAGGGTTGYIKASIHIRLKED